MYRAGFIGCGNMGGTLAAVAAKSVGGDQILTLDHHREKLEALHKAWGCIPATAEKAAKECRILFLGVKPQVMGKLAEELREPLKSRAAPPLLVSMAAGLSIETVSSLFGGARVLRIMPNTPAAVGEGVLLYAPGPGVTAEDERIYQRELARLALSLDQASRLGGRLIVMTHYPPVGENGAPTEASGLITASGARYCVYGHLHGASGRSAFNGTIDGTEFMCVSCDQLDFRLREIPLNQATSGT